MPSVECPECHLPTASTLGKTYCPQCGWNREAAEKQTRLLMRLLPVLVILFDAPLIVYIFLGHTGVSILAILGALAIVPAIFVVLVLRGKVRLSARTGQTAVGVTSQAGTTPITAPSEEVAAQYAVLAELQRPRLVRMSPQGKRNVAFISIGLLALAGALVALATLRPGAEQDDLTPTLRAVIYILPIGLAAMIGLVMQRALDQQRQLLSGGALAMARVTKQWEARNGFGIRYEFTAPTGETISRISTDYSRQLLEGMTVPVFYDAHAPEKQVALCAAFYEVMLPLKD